GRSRRGGAARRAGRRRPRVPVPDRGARGLREALHLAEVPGVRRQHEPHRGGAAGRALEPLSEDEGLRPAAAAQGRGGGVGGVIDPRDRFSGAADLYHRYRPSYPDTLLDWIERTTDLHPPARVADVGCGTGISSRLLAERGYDVKV